MSHVSYTTVIQYHSTYLSLSKESKHSFNLTASEVAFDFFILSKIFSEVPFESLVGSDIFLFTSAITSCMQVYDHVI